MRPANQNDRRFQITRLNLAVLRDLKTRMAGAASIPSRFDAADMPHARRLLQASFIAIVAGQVSITEAGDAALAA